MTATHPSDFALDRGGNEVDAHVATCPSCQERSTEARRLEAQGARIRRFDRPLRRTVRMVHRRANLSGAAADFVRYAADTASDD